MAHVRVRCEPTAHTLCDFPRGIVHTALAGTPTRLTPRFRVCSRKRVTIQTSQFTSPSTTNSLASIRLGSISDNTAALALLPSPIGGPSRMWGDSFEDDGFVCIAAPVVPATLFENAYYIDSAPFDSDYVRIERPVPFRKVTLSLPASDSVPSPKAVVAPPNTPIDQIPRSARSPVMMAGPSADEKSKKKRRKYVPMPAEFLGFSYAQHSPDDDLCDVFSTVNVNVDDDLVEDAYDRALYEAADEIEYQIESGRRCVTCPAIQRPAKADKRGLKPSHPSEKKRRRQRLRACRKGRVGTNMRGPDTSRGRRRAWRRHVLTGEPSMRRPALAPLGYRVRHPTSMSKPLVQTPYKFFVVPPWQRPAGWLDGEDDGSNHRTRRRRGRHVRVQDVHNLGNDELQVLLLQLQHRELSPADYELLLRLDESVKPKTVPADAVRAFPLVHAHEAGVCGVCLEEYAAEARLRQLTCGHKFHAMCIEKWLMSSSRNCPVDNLPVFD